MKRTLKTIGIVLLLFAFAVMLEKCGKQDYHSSDTSTYFDLGTGTYREPFVGILSSRPKILVWSMSIPPYKYFADDTLRFRRDFNIEFNDESIRYYEQKKEETQIMFKSQPGVLFSPESLNVPAKPGLMRFSTICTVNPELGNVVTMSKMEINNAAVDEVNSMKVSSTGNASIKDCRAAQKIRRPWVLWYLWLLTVSLPFLIIFLCKGNKNNNNNKNKKDMKNNQNAKGKLTCLLIILLLCFAGCETRTELKKSDIKQMLNRETAVHVAQQTVRSNAEYYVTGTWEDIKNFFGDRQITIPVEANFKYTIYFSEISDIRIDGREITLTLPTPHMELESCKPLWDKTVENVGLLRSKFSTKEKKDIAKSAIEDLCNIALRDKSNVTAANRVAESQLESLFGSYGYDVIVNYTITNPIIDIK